MPKIRILHKGLILVAVPLIFGIGFISLLFFGVLDTSRLIDREFMLKDAMVSHLSTLTAGYCAVAGKQMYAGTQNPAWQKYYMAQQKRAFEMDKHLRKILKNEHLDIPAFKQSSVSMSRTHRAVTPLLLKLQDMSNEESRSSLKSIERLRVILYGGITVGIVISVLLAIFFCLNISNRLLIIVNNALNLSYGRAMNPPFQGNDEIAELDQLLYKSGTDIRELERFKKEMVGVVSHELKSPLSSVGSFLSSLSSGVYGELTEKAQDKATRTYANVKRLMGLVAELLYLDRLELDMNAETIDVDELVASSVDTVKELSEKSGIEIRVSSEGGTVYADRNRLLQVIVNLLSNAMKFSPPNGLVMLEAKSHDGSFECSVTDQGCGIPEVFRNQIFEPFKQLDSSDGASKKGTGLGLTISRSIVEQHGGEIGVASELNKGSTFWFKIPQRENSDKAILASEKAEPAASLQMVRNSSNSQSGKFRVLYQGLVIIALPLVFQIGFALVFNNMLDGLCKQTQQEKKPMKVLNALSKATDSVSRSLEQALVSLYVPVRGSWTEAEKNAVTFINDAIELSKDNASQLADLNKAKEIIGILSAVFEHEAQTHESRAVFDSLSFGYRRYVYEAYRLRLEPETPEEREADQDPQPPTTFELLQAFRAVSQDYLHTHLLPFVDLKSCLDRTTDREKKISQDEAKQRSAKIEQLKLVLIGAVVATVTVSTFIALFLMRSISSRLQHIMQNTERLARRETLAPAIAGYDEIALLDRVLYESGNRLMELETFKRELVSIVSHELRTPLLSISSALEIFNTGIFGELSAKGTNRLRYAQEEADRLIRLINDLLDIEKMEAGKFVLDFSEVSIADLLETSAAAVAQLAEAKQINIEIVNEGPVQKVLVDHDRLCQVFINLLSNAIKYSPEHGAIIFIAEKTKEAQIKFSIKDQGRGIPEESRQKIFDRFVQVEKSDATERGGTGLGLAICKAIVEQHGGQIGVDSQMGVGSTFWFEVPNRTVDVPVAAGH